MEENKKTIDLDEIIEETEQAVRMLRSIEVDDKFDPISIGHILLGIKKEAQKLSADLNSCAELPNVVSPDIVQDSKFVKVLKKIDKSLQKIELYKKRIRPWIKSVAGPTNPDIVIDGNKLLAFDGAEFVGVLYRSLLFREPDAESQKNCMGRLFDSQTTKLDLIYDVWRSQEGQKNHICVRGLGIKRFMTKLQRKIKNIPVAGYVARWISNLVLLPKRMGSLQQSVDALNFNLYLINQRANQTDGDVRRISQYAEQTNGVVEQVAERTRLNGEHLNSIQTMMDKEQNVLHDLKTKRDHQGAILDRIYLDYKTDFMFKARQDVLNSYAVYDEPLEKWAAGKTKAALKVVDLGCGFGEWMEFLLSKGFAPLGVDSNHLIIEKVKREFPILHIKEQDAMQYLREQATESCDFISSFHMIEHLDLSELFDFFDESKRVLKNGGMLLLVTPNIQNIIIATYLFHMDPTHKTPIPVELLEFYVKEWGFSLLKTISNIPLNFFPYEYNTDDTFKHVAFRFNMEQEYAVLAVKK